MNSCGGFIHTSVIEYLEYRGTRLRVFYAGLPELYLLLDYLDTATHLILWILLLWNWNMFWYFLSHWWLMVAFGELAVIFCVGVVDTIPWRMKAVFQSRRTLSRSVFYRSLFDWLVVDCWRTICTDSVLNLKLVSFGCARLDPSKTFWSSNKHDIVLGNRH